MPIVHPGEEGICQAVDQLEAMIGRGVPALEQWTVMHNLRNRASKQVDPEVLKRALLRLVSFAQAQAESRALLSASYALFGCGLLIEQGAPAEPIGELTLQLLREAARCAINLRVQGVDVPSVQQQQQVFPPPAPRKGRRLGQRRNALRSQDPQDPKRTNSRRQRYETSCASLYPLLSPIFLHVLLRCKEIRKRVRTEDEFLHNLFLLEHLLSEHSKNCTDDCCGAADSIRFSPERHTSHDSHLTRVLSVLDDEELVVLYPLTTQGYRVMISGITHNYQLHTLLADLLLGDPDQGFLPRSIGKRPASQLVAAMRDQALSLATPQGRTLFDFFSWTNTQATSLIRQLTPNIPIPLEGTPADIPLIGSTRILVLSPPTAARFWEFPRVFPEMQGELYLREILPATTVRNVLQRT